MNTFLDRFNADFNDRRERSHMCYDTLMREGKVKELHRQLEMLLVSAMDFFRLSFWSDRHGLCIFVQVNNEIAEPYCKVDFSSLAYAPFYELGRLLRDHPYRRTVILLVAELIKALPTVKAQRVNGKEIGEFYYVIMYEPNTPNAFSKKVFVF